MKDSVIIIGSGLGGLECGYVLARHGYQVTVFEQDTCIGGCLQTFRRKGSDGMLHSFDTGFHYVGGLDEGQSLYPLFRYFGLLDLPWKRLDGGCADEVVFTGNSTRYPLPTGHDRFVERLSEIFPEQHDALGEYASFLKGVGDNIFRAFSPDGGMNSLFGRSAYSFLCGTISDPVLRNVLSGSSLKLELDRDTLPLYEFAQINNSFMQSSWRLGTDSVSGISGGALIAGSLASGIRRMGGEIRTGARVESIKVNADGTAAGVMVSSSSGAEAEFIPAAWIISDAHPSVTVDLIEECRAVRKIYRRRIGGLRNTRGIFTANIILKPDTLPYQNRNIFVHRTGEDLWSPEHGGSVMIHFYPDDRCIDLLSPMDAGWREDWAEAGPGHRGEEYETLKREKLAGCLKLAEEGLAEVLGGRSLADCIDRVYTSTPLTWNSYTGTPHGSAYGVVKDWTNSMSTILSPRTPLPNLLMTGQSLNLHGILGVSMTSVLTSSCIIGMETLISEILLNL